MKPYKINARKKLNFRPSSKIKEDELNEKITITLHSFNSVIIFGQAMPSGLSALDNEYLQSLPDAVRKDIEAEIEKNENEENSSLKETFEWTSKYDLVNEWEQFKRQRNEELTRRKIWAQLVETMQSSFMPMMNQILVITIF